MLRFEKEYYKAKNYVLDVFDSYTEEDAEEEDEYFTCPECCEPLYAIDYDSSTSWNEKYKKPWSYCPVCGYDWYNDTYGDYEEEDDYYDEV